MAAPNRNPSPAIHQLAHIPSPQTDTRSNAQLIVANLIAIATSKQDATAIAAARELLERIEGKVPTALSAATTTELEEFLEWQRWRNQTQTKTLDQVLEEMKAAIENSGYYTVRESTDEECQARTGYTKAQLAKLHTNPRTA